jgi:hypothetical protein
MSLALLVSDAVTMACRLVAQSKMYLCMYVSGHDEEEE